MDKRIRDRLLSTCDRAYTKNSFLGLRKIVRAVYLDPAEQFIFIKEFVEYKREVASGKRGKSV